jgi:hypothetical protein
MGSFAVLGLAALIACSNAAAGITPAAGSAYSIDEVTGALKQLPGSPYGGLVYPWGTAMCHSVNGACRPTSL